LRQSLSSNLLMRILNASGRPQFDPVPENLFLQHPDSQVLMTGLEIC
jgi:hypothetical protein